jgi:hypothetical protein
MRHRLVPIGFAAGLIVAGVLMPTRAAADAMTTGPDTAPVRITDVGAQPSATPEPATMLLVGGGLAGAAAWRRHRRAKL